MNINYRHLVTALLISTGDILPGDRRPRTAAFDVLIATARTVDCAAESARDCSERVSRAAMEFAQSAARTGLVTECWSMPDGRYVAELHAHVATAKACTELLTETWSMFAGPSYRLLDAVRIVQLHVPMSDDRSSYVTDAYLAELGGLLKLAAAFRAEETALYQAHRDAMDAAELARRADREAARVAAHQAKLAAKRQMRTARRNAEAAK